MNFNPSDKLTNDQVMKMANLIHEDDAEATQDELARILAGSTSTTPQKIRNPRFMVVIGGKHSEYYPEGLNFKDMAAKFSLPSPLNLAEVYLAEFKEGKEVNRAPVTIGR